MPFALSRLTHRRISVFSASSRRASALVVLAACAVPWWVQAQTCSSPNADADYILGDAGGTASAMHWTSGLVWKRCVEGEAFAGGNCSTGSAPSKTWNTWAETDGLLPQSFTTQTNWGIGAGFNQNLLSSGAWRMAYKTELVEINASCSGSPLLNQNVFPDIPVADFWSASPRGAGFQNAWLVNSGNAYAYDAQRNNARPVLLVRGGQPFAALATPAAQAAAASAPVTFAAFTLAPRSGLGQAWGGARIGGAGNPEFQLNGAGAWVQEAIVQSGDQITVRMTAPPAGSHTAIFTLRSGNAAGTNANGTNSGNEVTLMQEEAANFVLTVAAPAAATPPAAIPTLSEWGTVLLSLLAGLLGWRKLQSQTAVRTR